MDAASLLFEWMSMHGVLTLEQQKHLLARGEVAELTRIDDRALRAALPLAKLDRVLAEARSHEWWFRGEACEEDGLPSCARCKPSRYPPVVVVSGGGGTFHRAETCAFLRGGQQKVARRGGTPADLEHVAVQVALGRGHLPCLRCFS